MESQQQLKMPPVLVDEDGYGEWLNDVKIWQLFTDLEKKKQSPALYLTLTGRARMRECVLELTPEVIGGDDGVKKIIEKLDKLFMKDQNTRAHLAFKEFYDYCRPAGVSITDFIVRFEYLYLKLKQFDMKLPEGVQSFFLLNAANISEDNEKLARVGEITYENIKAKRQKIFGDPAASEGSGGAPAVKSEPVFETKHEDVYESTSSRGRGRGGKHRGRSQVRFRTGETINRQSNPISKDGKVLRCFNYDSTKHLSNNCPYPRGDDSRTQDIHITLFNGKPDKAMSALITEALGMAVLDSACTKAVTGETWLNLFIDTLTEEDKKLVNIRPSDMNFRFGDGIEVNSTEIVKFPAVIGTKKAMIKANIVKNDIPLLLSRTLMKRAQMVLDFETDTGEVLGNKVDLHCISSGHYCLPLTNLLFQDKPNSCASIVLHTLNLKQLSRSEKMKKGMKLRRQFSHASKEKICKLVKESKHFSDKDFLDITEGCCDSCEICQKFVHPPLRPVVGLNLANNFNEVVCMDLKEDVHNGSWILHLIDAATRYSAACLINTKHQDEIMSQIYLMWIAYFGCPCKFLSDNGEELSNDSCREMNEKLNIETATTAAESPFSNGIVERHNLILAEAMQKTLLDVKCDPQIALVWAVSAKNALQNHGRFSPNQLVFGHNINTPCILTDKLPALESTTSSDIIRRNMEAMLKQGNTLYKQNRVR